VAATDGTTRIYLAPGYDSLSAAWARRFAPLVQPLDSLSPGLRGALPPPAGAFDAALDAAQRLAGDTGWVRRPGTPVETVAPAPGEPDGAVVWRLQSFETGSPARLVALFAGTQTWGGPAYALWRPDSAFRALRPVLGSSEIRPGALRTWPAAGAVLQVQARFQQPERPLAPATLSQVFVGWRDGMGEGPDARAAWADLLGQVGGAARRGMPADLWVRARRLLAQADSALRAGDIERFGRLYSELVRLFDLEPAQLAPAQRPRYVPTP
jgi:hypothetical protein